MDRSTLEYMDSTQHTASQDYGHRYQAAIATELRAEKARLKRSNADLARATGISEPTIGRYLHTAKIKRDIPFNDLVAMCGALGIDVLDLVARAKRQLEDGAD